MQTVRILIVDDEIAVVSIVKRNLSHFLENCEILTAYDGEQGINYVHQYNPHLVIIDVKMPKMNGIQMLRNMRNDERTMEIPVIMLTADSSERSHIESLRIGADDYLSKPCRTAVLAAHIKARLQKGSGRSRSSSADWLYYADVQINTQSRLAFRGPRELELTPREFDLLVCFLRHPRQVLSRNALIEGAWGFDFEGDTAMVDVYVGYLRRKLEIRGQSRLIQTERGIGYVLREQKTETSVQDGTL